MLTPEEPDRPCTGLSILVVDDNRNLRELLRAVFEDAGAVVRDAASVEQAQTLLEHALPDAVITDLELLPEERGGVSILEHGKGRAPSCAVVLLTGRSDEYDELCGIGFDEVLLKPKRTADLISSILATTARCRSDWNQKTAAA